MAVVVTIAVVRLGVRWYRRRSPRPRKTLGYGWLAGDTALVATREIRERVRARSFKVVTALLLAAVAGAIILPVALKGSGHPQHIGTVGALSGPQRAAIAAAAKAVGTSADFVAEQDRASAEADLRSGRIDLAVIEGQKVMAKKAVTPTETTATARLAYTAAAELGVLRSFAQAGLSPGQVATITSGKPLPVTSVEPPSSRSGPARATSLIGIIIVFIMLSQYETWTLIGVMEEKSSRVVEVLLATVRPMQLLGGKVLGIGTVAMAQAGVLLAFALVLAKVAGSDLLQGSGPLTLAAALVWLLFGYAFYCWVYAAAGSLAERQDQVQTLALPLSLPMVLGYVMAITAASSGHASVFFQVLAYLPPTAPFAMPVLVGLGAVSWWGFLASIGISVLATVAVARVAALVYRRAVLRTGRRVSLREAIGA